ncbi:MAG: DUF555 domain-containing protein [Halobacteriales archaeon]
MDYTVVLEGAWLVEDVETMDDALSVAVSEAGRSLNPDKDYVEVEVGLMGCPHCGDVFDCVTLVAGQALVGLEFEIDVYDVEGERHASRIGKKEVGEAMPGVPLDVVEVHEKETDVGADDGDE